MTTKKIQGYKKVWSAIRSIVNVKQTNRYQTSNLIIENKTFFSLSTTAYHFNYFFTYIITDKVCGPNSIPTRIIKDFKEELSKPFSDVINISFSSGIFPNSMKLAKVVPVYKKDDKLDCNNYRPVSLLPN